MTNINVEVGELMRLSSRSEELNSDISSTFNGINNVLDNISGIVRSDTLTGANDIQKDGVNTLMVRIDENLRNIKIFLDNQIKNYTVSVEDALNSLNTLIAAINGAYGVNSGKSYTSFTTDKSTSDNVGVKNNVTTEKNYTVSSTPYNSNDSVDTSGYKSNEASGFVVTEGNTKYDLNDSDKDLLYAIVAAESDKSKDDALAVASTILNRCEDTRWVNSHGTNPIKQATAPNQFVVYQEGYYKKYTNGQAPEAVKQAVNDALNGVRNHNYLSFRSNGSTKYSSNMITETGNRYKNLMSVNG